MGWTPTGILTASEQIKAVPGFLARVDLRMTDNGADGNVRIWDSATGATGAAVVLLCQLAVITATTNAEGHWECPLEAGVEAISGIYLEVVAGDVEVVVLYK